SRRLAIARLGKERRGRGREVVNRGRACASGEQQDGDSGQGETLHESTAASKGRMPRRNVFGGLGVSGGPRQARLVSTGSTRLSPGLDGLGWSRQARPA